MKKFLCAFAIFLGIAMLVCALLFHWLFFFSAIGAFLTAAFIKK